MKNVLLMPQHEGEDTEDVDRSPERKVLFKTHLRDQGTRQRLLAFPSGEGALTF